MGFDCVNRATRGTTNISNMSPSPPETRPLEQGKEAEQRLGWSPSVIGGVLPAEHAVRPTHSFPGKYHDAMGPSRGGADM